MDNKNTTDVQLDSEVRTEHSVIMDVQVVAILGFQNAGNSDKKSSQISNQKLVNSY